METGPASAGRIMPEAAVEALLSWYRINIRKLPWRDNGGAYEIWVSEIMLQQTRTETVSAYYKRFLSELPNVQALAACPEEKLLKLWEGLGYYSRARNMQKAAKQVLEEYQGKIPSSPEQLLCLSGIGEYTAGAIASIAYGQPCPAVDGNVLRVMSRFSGSREDITLPVVKKKMKDRLSEVIPRDKPGDFNQALMDLGAMTCVPKGEIRCGRCPLSFWCKACEEGTARELPVKKRPRERMIEERTVLVIQDGVGTLIRKRPDKGLLAGLYELPNVPGHLTREEALAYVRESGLEPLKIQPLPESKHVFSHLEWRMSAYLLKVSSLASCREGNHLFVKRSEREQEYAVPSAFRAYISYMKEETR